MKHLSDYMNAKQTRLFNQTGSFFAFSQDQFNEKKQPGTQYIDLGAGLICPKENVNQLTKGLQDIHREAVKQDVAENGADQIIKREFFNHETNVTGDPHDVIEAIKGHKKHFPDLFTDQKINETINECFKAAEENDLF